MANDFSIANSVYGNFLVLENKAYGSGATGEIVGRDIIRARAFLAELKDIQTKVNAWLELADTQKGW